MLLTIFLAIVFCSAITLMLLSAVAFIQNEKLFSSAPKEVQDVVKPKEKELFVIFPAMSALAAWICTLF